MLACILVSCNQNTKTTHSIPLNVENYISYYSRSILKSTEAISIQFSEQIIDKTTIGTEVDRSFYDCNASSSYTALWSNDRTIEIRPSSTWEMGSTFDVEIFIAKIYGNDENAPKNMVLPYQVPPLEMKLGSGALEAITLDNPDKMAFKSYFEINDRIDTSALKKQFKINQKGNDAISFTWGKQIGDRFYFSIHPILKQAKESYVDFSFKGRSKQAALSFNERISVPAQGVFEISDVYVSEGEENMIHISFTEPLDPQQDLRGLVSMEPAGSKGQSRIKNNTIMLEIPENAGGQIQLTIHKGIKNTRGNTLDSDTTETITLEQAKPQLRLIGKGNIVPNDQQVVFPFEGINVHTVDVEIFQVFQDNVAQYLLDNELQYQYRNRYLGRVVHRETVDLRQLGNTIEQDQWQHFALDLQNITRLDPGSIYQVCIGFKPSYSMYTCPDSNIDEARLFGSGDDRLQTIMRDAYSIRYDGWTYEHREDPCQPAYYNRSQFIQRNILASNIGLVAKKGKENAVHIVTTDIRTAQAKSGVLIELFDEQRQFLSAGKTDVNGQLSMQAERKPLYVIAHAQQDKSYLVLHDHRANAVSEFDVSGTNIKKGINGYLYTERGVWRPGDSVHLNFILHDIDKTLTHDHPVILTVKDAKGKIAYKKTTHDHVDRLYYFPFATNINDPTGNWTASIQVGDQYFSKRLKIETVKPNRLKINIDVPSEEWTSEDKSLSLTSNWLHGASADGLKADVELQLENRPFNPEGYESYTFYDPARKVSTEREQIYTNSLDANGEARVALNINKTIQSPSKVTANLKTRVYEKSGNFSENYHSVHVSPYSSYVGISIPENRWGSKRISFSNPESIDCAVVDAKGKPISNRRLSVGIYKAEWRWWYNSSDYRLFRLNSATHTSAISTQSVTTDSDGKASFTPTIKEEYGNYLVRICDTESGHCTGDYFYSSYRSYGKEEENPGAQKLDLSTDKTSYTTGETITLRFPSAQNCKAIVSLENNERVIHSFIEEVSKDQTTIEIPVTADMIPTSYIHVQLIQPFDHKNDLPMRMYGVIPVTTVDPTTIIEPVLDMPDKVKPNEAFTIRVSEKNKQSMSYTIAVVDEGLLDLTQFKTPDPHQALYKKQALGVKTWDMYDHVLNMYGAEIASTISIGGDGENAAVKPAKANRFIPVVRYIQPQKLAAGQQRTHRIEMPNYVGSVRVMIIGCQGNAFGKSDKTVPVKQELMTLATAPRKLSTGESFYFPVNVFAMEDNIKNVDVNVGSSSHIVFERESETMRFNKPGDDIQFFKASVGDKLGIATLQAKAKSAGFSSTDDIEIDVVNPNPFRSEVEEALIPSGDSWNETLSPFGVTGSNEAFIEISSFPAINLQDRLQYLIRYPHGCTEQTTSAAFPQLYLADLMHLDREQKNAITTHIDKALQKLIQVQHSSGGFVYWSSRRSPNDWTSSYVGHFLIEAKEQGFFIPSRVLETWMDYQTKASNEFDPLEAIKNEEEYLLLHQAYRLYTLALAGQANVGAMNQLKEYCMKEASTPFLLAASYALLGQIEVAQELLSTEVPETTDYSRYRRNFGSKLRDVALICHANMVAGNKTAGLKHMYFLAKELGSNRWYSTHSTAFALQTLGKYIEEVSSADISYELNINGTPFTPDDPTKQIHIFPADIEALGSLDVNFTNQSKGPLYARIIRSGQDPVGIETPIENNLDLDVRFYDMDNRSLDISKLRQGTDFKVKIKVKSKNTSSYELKDVALTQMVPSGWEVRNFRMGNQENEAQKNTYSHQDIRDDRVNTYFDLYGSTSKEFTLFLTASYAGKFYMPGTYCEAMYDNDVNAKTKGQWVEVRLSNE